MKTSVVALALIVCVFACIGDISAVPVPEIETTGEPIALTLIEDVNTPDVLPAAEEGHEANRQKRATCDLLSFTGANHSLCAAHCIARGNRGGYCNGSAVCVCRN